MVGWWTKPKIRRRQVREQRVRTTAALRPTLSARLLSWPTFIGALFIAAAAAIAVWGDTTIGYSLHERIRHPIYARVDFQVPDEKQTADDKRAARAATPSYYTANAKALTFDRIRTELRQLYEAAADATTIEEFQEALKELNRTADETVFRRLRDQVNKLEDAGRTQFEEWIDKLPLEDEYVVPSLRGEDRDPKSTTDYIVLEMRGPDEKVEATRVPHSQIVSQGHEKALRGIATDVSRRFPPYELRRTVEDIVFSAFQEQPTIVFNQERTVEEMRRAEEATPVAMATFERGKPFVKPGMLTREHLQLLAAEHGAYLGYLQQASPEATRLRRAHLLRRIGLVTLVGILAIGLLMYTKLHQPRIFEIRPRSVAFTALMVGTLLAARALEVKWGHIPELMYAPCILCGSVLAIVYPRRFAIGATCILAVLIATTVEGSLTFLLTLFTGVAVVIYQLDEIRSRTKIISTGAITATVIMVASAAGGLLHAHSTEYLLRHTLWAGGCALLASFVLSGVLPFIERMFRIATSLTLLEWRDPTKPLLQLLAREAPGTYNHSLALGTLADAACGAIGANGLLAQVGTLYHDIGKIPKAEYFAENQQGHINRHDNLSPTMSLLIILGHVKDGIEMAKEYKLPRVLHQFIEEHHGTTVVRYFHHMASEKQPRIASGKHDREVSEAEFRYTGPKPRARESAVVMLCDGVESAVRSLPEPTAGRIESMVHQVVADRLSDGQLSDCDMTLREIRLVEESLVKSLCSIYHGRVAYPKARKAGDEMPEQEKMSV